MESKITNRLQNLLKMRRALLALAVTVNALTDEDEFLIEKIPNVEYLNAFAAHIAELIRKRIIVSHQAALPYDQADLFCPLCENETPHQRMTTGTINHYKCTKCGLVGGEL